MNEKTQGVLAILAGGIIGLVLLPADTTGAANLLTNGGFENTTQTGCAWNLSNADFTSSMAGTNAFGNSQELDIMVDPGGCSYGEPPTEGVVKVGMHTKESGEIDAFSFQLSSPVTAGNTYLLSFDAQVVLDFDPGFNEVQIGLSNDPGSLGTLIYSGVPNTSWTTMGDTIVAPVDGAYLTVSSGPVVDAWVHVDNFVFDDQGGTPSWQTGYHHILSTADDLDLLRRYRDEYLSKSLQGKALTALLYEKSDEVLTILLKNPGLLVEAEGLVIANINAVETVLNGRRGIITGTDDIIAFLEKFAARVDQTPPDLKVFVNGVISRMQQARKRDKPFLGFMLR